MFSSRLDTFIKHLNKSHYAFETSIGVSKGAVRKPIVNNKTIGVDIMEKIISIYPELNIDWLVTGRGEMLLKSSTFPSHPNENTGIKYGNEYGNISKSEKLFPDFNIKIPIMDTYAGASNQGYLTQGHIEEKDSITLPATMLQAGKKYVCIQIRGESMLPTLHDKDYIIAKLIENGDYQNMVNDKIYAIITQDHDTIIKRVRNYIDAGYFLCYPDNIYHTSFKVHHEDVFQIYEVTARLTPHLEQTPLIENLERLFTVKR